MVFRCSKKSEKKLARGEVESEVVHLNLLRTTDGVMCYGVLGRENARTCPWYLTVGPCQICGQALVSNK